MGPAIRAAARLNRSANSIWRLPGSARCLSCSISSSYAGPLERTYANRHSKFPTPPHTPTLPEIGQPIFETHPHLLGAGEVTPGISAMEYAVRRAKLAAELPEGAVAIIPSAPMKYRSGPVFYEFHQDPDFYYLTGFLEHDSVCVIEKTGKDGEHTFYLFVRPKNEAEELWDGPRAGIENAMDIFNADESGDINNIQNLIAPIVKRATAVYSDVARKSTPRSGFERLFHSTPDFSSLANGTAKKVKQLRPIMDKLRVVKSPAEVKNMRIAGRMSGLAHNALIRDTPWDSEARIAAHFEWCVKLGGHKSSGDMVGCEKQAYVPVVAKGKKALTLHYTRNNDIVAEGDMVLIDAGGQYGGYATDITRTWPNAKKFSDAQRDLYSVVLQAQRKCVSLCRENADNSLDELHEIAHEELYDGLKQLGFDITSPELRDYLFPHHVGHYVGLDLHDTKSYGRIAALQTGNCVTIEPGVYVPDDERFPQHFRGIGIRIEDSVCVGDDGPIVLTTEAVKEVEDIEALIDA